MHTLLSGLLFLFLAASVNAQCLLSAAGQVHEAQNCSLSWSLGEPLTLHYSHETAGLMQGFQQTHRQTSAVFIPALENQLSIYPNPARGNRVTVQSSICKISHLRVCDATGKVIINDAVHEMTVQIEAGRMKTGLYLVQIILEGSDTPLCRRLILE